MLHKSLYQPKYTLLNNFFIGLCATKLLRNEYGRVNFKLLTWLKRQEKRDAIAQQRGVLSTLVGTIRVVGKSMSESWQRVKARNWR